MSGFVSDSVCIWIIICLYFVLCFPLYLFSPEFCPSVLSFISLCGHRSPVLCSSHSFIPFTCPQLVHLVLQSRSWQNRVLYLCYFLLFSVCITRPLRPAPPPHPPHLPMQFSLLCSSEGSPFYFFGLCFNLIFLCWICFPDFLAVYSLLNFLNFLCIGCTSTSVIIIINNSLLDILM